MINLHFIWILILFHGMSTNLGRICCLPNGSRYAPSVFFIFITFGSYVQCVRWFIGSVALLHSYSICLIQVFKFGSKDGKPANKLIEEHSYIIHPVTGNAKYSKLRLNEYANSGKPLHKAAVDLDEVTLCLSQVHFVLCLQAVFIFFNIFYQLWNFSFSCSMDTEMFWRWRIILLPLTNALNLLIIVHMCLWNLILDLGGNMLIELSPTRWRRQGT